MMGPWDEATQDGGYYPLCSKCYDSLLVVLLERGEVAVAERIAE